MMARKSSSTILQEDLYPVAEPRGYDPSPRTSREEDWDDARLLDLEADEESPFLRAQKRVAVRRGTLPQKTAHRLAWTALALFVAGICVAGVAALYHYGEHSWRFRIESGDDIEISGLENVSRAQVMEVLGADIGRNIFFVPLAQRKAQLEQIPWVKSAGVMRFAPNHLQVQISERRPVAFARTGSKIYLLDEAGTLMDLPASRKKYSFPVILGMNAGEPASSRKARMKIYNDLMGQLDSAGARYSQDISEVDLSDLDDVKVLANNADGNVLVHLGSADYLARYTIYVAHVKEWRQQFDKVSSVDLRYEGQIVVNPDAEGVVNKATLSTSAVKRAIAASVKPAAFIMHEGPPPKPVPALHPAFAPRDAPQGSAPRKDATNKDEPNKSAPHKPAPARVASAAHSARPRKQSRKTPARIRSTIAKPANRNLKAPVVRAASVQPVNASARKKPSPAILKEPESKE